MYIKIYTNNPKTHIYMYICRYIYIYIYVCIYKNYIYTYPQIPTKKKKTITTNAKTPIEIMFSCTHGLCPMLSICHCVKHKDIPLESHQGRNWKHGISPIDLDHGHINASPKKPHQRRRTLNMCIVYYRKGHVPNIETKKKQAYIHNQYVYTYKDL